MMVAAVVAILAEQGGCGAGASPVGRGELEMGGQSTLAVSFSEWCCYGNVHASRKELKTKIWKNPIASEKYADFNNQNLIMQGNRISYRAVQRSQFDSQFIVVLFRVPPQE